MRGKSEDKAEEMDMDQQGQHRYSRPSTRTQMHASTYPPAHEFSVHRSSSPSHFLRPPFLPCIHPCIPHRLSPPSRCANPDLLPPPLAPHYHPSPPLPARAQARAHCHCGCLRRSMAPTWCGARKSLRRKSAHARAPTTRTQARLSLWSSPAAMRCSRRCPRASA